MNTLIQNPLEFKRLDSLNSTFSITSNDSDTLKNNEAALITSLVQSTEDLTQKLMVNTEDACSIIAALSTNINVVTKVKAIVDLIYGANVLVLDVKADLQTFRNIPIPHPADLVGLLATQKSQLNAIHIKTGNILSKCKELLNNCRICSSLNKTIKGMSSE